MPDLYGELTTAFTRIAARPVPPRWVDREPVLTGHASIATVHETIRYDLRTGLVDDTVRALVHLAPDDPDAALTVLHALAVFIPSRVGPRPSVQFKEEVLVDLACVILDAGDVDHLDQLPKRLTRRAYRRARRRIETFDRYREHEKPVEMADLSSAITTADDVADLATNRAHLHAFQRSVKTAIDEGRLRADTWEAYRDGRLAPAIGAQRGDATRSRVYRAARTVERELVHAS